MRGKMRAGQDDGALTGPSERGMQARCVAASRFRRPTSGRIGVRSGVDDGEGGGNPGSGRRLARVACRAWLQGGLAETRCRGLGRGRGGFELRIQNESDLDAARWGLLAWEDPRERSGFKPFWIDGRMLEGELVEPAGSALPAMAVARATGTDVSGLRLLDGALVLKFRRWRRVEQVRVSEGGSLDMERAALQLRWPFQVSPPEELPRMFNLDAMTTPRKRASGSR